MDDIMRTIESIEKLMKERVDSFKAIPYPTVKDITDKDEFIDTCLKTRDSLNTLYQWKAKQKK